MDTFYRIVSLLGGLALFLYGMRVMGDGLKSSSGGAMKAVLAKVTNKPVMSFILGLLVTCMIQSSTATIVLTVGLVGAGFLTFRQSVGIVLGANVGTAITAQIIRLMDVDAGESSVLYFFKSDNLAPFALLVGMILIMFIGKRKRNAANAGTILMGFGILFVGLMNMSSAVSTFGDTLSTLLTSFEDNYFLGFLSGVAVTGVIQSSSAVIGILQSIASSVGVTFCGVFAVIIGVNIGDCITTYLVCRLGAKTEQIRTCVVHIIYNVIAAVMLFSVIGILRAAGVINDDIWFSPLNSGGVANIHGLFRLIPAILLLPFSGILANLAEKAVPGKQEDAEESDIEKNLRELDMRLITNPAIALNETAHLIGHMADVALHNYEASVQQLYEYDPRRFERINQREDLLDRMTDASNQYIVAVSPHIATDRDNINQNFQLRAMTCYERIGDLALHISENIENLKRAQKEFSPTAMEELRVLTKAVKEILENTSQAFKTNQNRLAQTVEPLEEVIDELIEDLKRRHVYRMTHGLCDIFNGIEFQNILLHLERISDQCSDLAVYMLGRTDQSISGNEHQYLQNLHQSDDQVYKQAFESGYDRYFNQLKGIPVTPEGTERTPEV